jgi:hypothetical protein
MTKPEPRWAVPAPYGYAAAIESMGLVSAPLLAGFSVTLAIFVIQSHNRFHWASAALFLLIGAALAFIATVQFTFRARQYAVTPQEIEMWWTDSGESGRREILRGEQRFYRYQHEMWARLARSGYEVAIVVFLLAVAVLLVPPGGVDAASNGRLAVIVLALAGWVGEVAWILRTRFSDSSRQGWPTQIGPEFPAPKSGC